MKTSVIFQSEHKNQDQVIFRENHGTDGKLEEIVTKAI